MKLEEALPALREGKRIRRKEWEQGIWTDPNSLCEEIPEEQLLKDDWEVEPGLELIQCSFIYDSGHILSLALKKDMTAEALSELILKTFQAQ